MKKEIKKIIKKVEEPEVEFAPVISKIETSFGNGELNVLKDKINEIVDKLN